MLQPFETIQKLLRQSGNFPERLEFPECLKFPECMKFTVSEISRVSEICSAICKLFRVYRNFSERVDTFQSIQYLETFHCLETFQSVLKVFQIVISFTFSGINILDFEMLMLLKKFFWNCTWAKTDITRARWGPFFRAGPLFLGHKMR